MNILLMILSAIISLVTGMFFLGLARKIMAMIHWRYGPPIYQPLIDVIRYFHQRAVSHGFIFDLGIIISLIGSLLVVFFLPLGNISSFSNSGGLLVILYILILSPLGLALSSGESANPNASIGISRKLILTLSYEFVLIIILLSLMSQYQTISLQEIVMLQARKVWSFASWKLILPGIAYLLILPAMLGFRPFEIAGASQEISAGPSVEFGGKYLALNTINHGLLHFITIALFVNLFLGGGDLFGIFDSISGTFWGSFVSLIIFLIKMILIFVISVFINAVFPRLRLEQATKYILYYPLSIAIVGLIIVVAIN